MGDLVVIVSKIYKSDHILSENKLKLMTSIERHCNLLFQIKSTSILDILPESQLPIESDEVWNKDGGYEAFLISGSKAADRFSFKSTRFLQYQSLIEKVAENCSEILHAKFVLGKLGSKETASKMIKAMCKDKHRYSIVVQELVRSEEPSLSHTKNYACLQKDLFYSVWEENFYLDEFKKHDYIPLEPDHYPMNLQYQYLLTPDGPLLESRLWFFRLNTKGQKYWQGTENFDGYGHQPTGFTSKKPCGNTNSGPSGLAPMEPVPFIA
jgi:hypothetical protein